jgi:antitoxin (DNA-binding transcriptional repressor) of toxin-antitoxin stability system
MKTIELVTRTANKVEEQMQQLGQQSVILTLGNKPVAALLPMADKIAHLAKFEQVVESEETVTVTVAGKPIAILQLLVPLVLIGDEEMDLEAVALSTHPQFLELIERSRQSHKAEGGISSDEMRRRLADG